MQLVTNDFNKQFSINQSNAKKRQRIDTQSLTTWHEHNYFLPWPLESKQLNTFTNWKIFWNFKKKHYLRPKKVHPPNQCWHIQLGQVTNDLNKLFSINQGIAKKRQWIDTWSLTTSTQILMPWPLAATQHIDDKLKTMILQGFCKLKKQHY